MGSIPIMAIKDYTSDLRLGTVVGGALARNIEIPVYFGIPLQGLTYTPAIIIPENTLSFPFGLCWKGKDKLMIKDITLCTTLSLDPITDPEEVIHHRMELAVCGIVTNAETALGLTARVNYGGLAPGKWGHARTGYTFKIMEKTVHRWWTECNGPGYACSYDHPSGIEIQAGT